MPGSSLGCGCPAVGRRQPNEAAAQEALRDMAAVFGDAKSSALGEALQVALEEHFAGERQPSSVLVVTAGEVTDGSDVSLADQGRRHPSALADLRWNGKFP